jgi:predicted metal-dependent HD superfamily phosphohydrolase
MDVQAAENYIVERLRNELKPDLTYHNLAHTLGVAEAAQEIGEEEGLSAEELRLLKTAALYHDAGFLLAYRDHENASCSLAKKILPRFGFTSQEIDKICGMITATRIPQQPYNLLEEVLVDADLDYLGRDDYAEIADSLYNEFLSYGVVKNEKEWNRLQVKFFENHRYFTHTAAAKRNEKKAQHLKALKEIVSGY